ncbi:aldehyde dehydrogenase family protein [Phyllobacterium endophyticum]|uniref:aldehyde dehydrogenase family protein n=1 Tax=Phyllobacterium endophyticum TaxID=1149773 RepID=UPI001FE106B8|nr:aldehyde dehydrogenase family protein [Phyllobacterium endophyticum]
MSKSPFGGERVGNEGYFYAPTLLRDVPDNARIMSEEPFGPIASTTTFNNVGEIIGRANSLSYGLTGRGKVASGQQPAGRAMTARVQRLGRLMGLPLRQPGPSNEAGRITRYLSAHPAGR